jgi:wyosine [tRNA(Phe)-imidazoG37] synthetase (radical SAM superfamily)
MKHIFGPVPSRRLGRSLGIDPVPLKTCNFSCIYCQLGRTKPLTCLRQEFISSEEIISELGVALEAHRGNNIDWITFVGSGETALHSRLGWLIRQVKKLTPLPVAVITNGSLLFKPAVREELAAADAVLPSLDAGSEKLFNQISRGHRTFAFETHLQGLRLFRREYSGKLWIEVMLVRGLNDTQEALDGLSSALETVEPDEIHICVPDRVPCESWVEIPDAAGLDRASTALGRAARVILPAKGSFDLGFEGDTLDSVLAIIKRHPMREAELVRSLGQWRPGHVFETLAALSLSGKSQVALRDGTRYWCSADAHFPDNDW